jgi:hypothetical protein
MDDFAHYSTVLLQDSLKIYEVKRGEKMKVLKIVLMTIAVGVTVFVIDVKALPWVYCYLIRIGMA